MASSRLSAQWRDDLAVMLAHCRDAIELQQCAEEMHRQKGHMTNEDYGTLRALYRRAVERLKETQT